MEFENLVILQRCANELNKMDVPNWFHITDKKLDEIRQTKHNIATLIYQIIKEEREKI